MCVYFTSVPEKVFLSSSASKAATSAAPYCTQPPIPPSVQLSTPNAQPPSLLHTQTSDQNQHPQPSEYRTLNFHQTNSTDAEGSRLKRNIFREFFHVIFCQCIRMIDQQMLRLPFLMSRNQCEDSHRGWSEPRKFAPMAVPIIGPSSLYPTQHPHTPILSILWMASQERAVLGAEIYCQIFRL